MCEAVFTIHKTNHFSRVTVRRCGTTLRRTQPVYYKLQCSRLLYIVDLSLNSCSDYHVFIAVYAITDTTGKNKCQPN